MNMKKQLLLLLSAMLVSVSLRSQSIIQDSNNEQDKKYTPPVGSAFNDLGVRRPSDSEPVRVRNVLKFVPTAMFRQKILFTYERDISKGFVAGFWLGKSFGRDFLQQLAIMTLGSSDSYDVIDGSTLILQSKYTGSSPFVNVHLRGYFSGDVFDGSFVELGYSHERTDYLVEESVNGYLVSGDRKAEFKMNMLTLSFGATLESGNFCHEFFVNMGVKLFRHTQFQKYQYNTGTATYPINQEYYLKTNNLSEIITPAFSVGYSLGLGF